MANVIVHEAFGTISFTARHAVEDFVELVHLACHMLCLFHFSDHLFDWPISHIPVLVLLNAAFGAPVSRQLIDAALAKQCIAVWAHLHYGPYLQQAHCALASLSLIVARIICLLIRIHSCQCQQIPVHDFFLR